MTDEKKPPQEVAGVGLLIRGATPSTGSSGYRVNWGEVSRHRRRSQHLVVNDMLSVKIRAGSC